MPFKLIAATSAVLFSYQANASLSIFTCQPDWASLAQYHAPDAKIYSATTAFQDPHYVQARPSLIAKMRRADLVICSGSELEIGWLPELQRQSRNPKVQNGQPGLFFTTDHVELLDQTDHVDRSMGDVHGQGNPHVQFAIDAMPNISRALTETLIKLDPQHGDQYTSSGKDFREKWQQHREIWRKQATELQNIKVVGYHSTYRYLFEWLNIDQVADLEPNPGLPPTTSHLAQLAARSFNGVSGIVYSSHQSSDAADWLSQRTDLPIAVLAQSVGGREESEDLFALIDDSIQQLLALKEPK